jgi:hypothetical protein
VLTRLPALAALLALSLTACSGDDTSGTDAGSEPTADAGAGSPTRAVGRQAKLMLAGAGFAPRWALRGINARMAGH